MPPKAKTSKKGAGGETVIVPGRVITLPRPNLPTVEVAHPTSLPSFLAASSLFVLASHSTCNLVPTAATNNNNNASTAAESSSAIIPALAGIESSARGRTSTPRGKNISAAMSTNNNNNAASRATPTTKGGKGGKDNHDSHVDFNSAIPSVPLNVNVTAKNGTAWNLQVAKKTIFLCDALIGELDSQNNNNNNNDLMNLTNGSTASSSLLQNHNNNINNNTTIDFNKLSSFFAASSGRHGLVVIRDENNNQRVFAGGMNEEGQLPLPVRTDQQSSVVADTSAVPFKEMKNLEFKLVSNTSNNDGDSGAAALKNEEISSSSSHLLSQHNNILRPADGALIVSAACGSAHTVVLVRNNANKSNNNSGNALITSRSQMGARRRALMNFDTWQPNPTTFLFGCGRKEAIGEFTLPPNVSGSNSSSSSTVVNNKNTTLSSNKPAPLSPLDQFKMDTSPRRAVPPEENCFRHLTVGDGEDFDALWAYGDLTFARGRRGLVCFGTITSASVNGCENSSSSALKYSSPTQALVVIPAPLGCLVKEVIVLNAVADHPRKIYVFLEDANAKESSTSTAKTNSSNGIDEFDEYFYNINNNASSSSRNKRTNFSNNNNNTNSNNNNNSKIPASYYYPSSRISSTSSQDSSANSSSAYNSHRRLFDGTRLLEVHIAFLAGHGGELKKLHPPPPIFSFADVTDRILGPVAANLRMMGAPLFRLKKLTCGAEHAVGVTVDGAVIGFGSNYFGQLGESGGGSDQGPKFADESLVGPRTARMYPSPDCSAVSGKLHRQYYESAILLRPPALKRSPLIIAQAYAQYKGRTVEFNDVVSVVPIPERGGGAASMMGSSSSSNNNNFVSSPTTSSSANGGGRNENNLSPTSEDDSSSTPRDGRSPLDENNNNSYQQYDDEDDEDDFDDSENNDSSAFANYSSPTTKSGKSSAAGLTRKGTAAPKSLSLAAAAARNNNDSSAASKSKQQNNSNNSNDQQSDSQQQQSGSKNNVVDKLRVAMNPSWPADTVVDCCCGPLFTALMQSNAELIFFGDHVPLHLQQEEAQKRSSSPTKQ